MKIKTTSVTLAYRANGLTEFGGRIVREMNRKQFKSINFNKFYYSKSSDFLKGPNG